MRQICVLTSTVTAKATVVAWYPERHPSKREVALSIAVAVTERFGISGPTTGLPASVPGTRLLEDAMKTINICALGPSGAGKTVFMAAMYRQLRIKREDADFYLETDYITSVHMNSVFNAVANPTEDWPASTRSFNEWEFRLNVPTPAGQFEAAKMTYYDYPGGLLTAPRAAEDERFREVIAKFKRAHALLVLLDGAGVLACLKGEPQGRRFLDFDVSSSLEIVQQTRCPVHFAVTKWDLLEAEYTLGEVRDLLLHDDNFHDLIRSRTQYVSGPIRLIPVSSVGRGFATMQANGQMRKLGEPARPFQVELPFMSVLPDFFAYAYAELQSQDQELLRKVKKSIRTAEVDELIGKNKGRMAAFQDLTRRFVTPRVVKTLKATNPILAALLPDDPEELLKITFIVVEAATRRAAVLADKRRSTSAAEVASLRAGVRDGLSAMQLLDTQFRDIVTRFENEYPDSLLATPELV